MLTLIYYIEGLLERYHITRQQLKFDTCVVVAAKFEHEAHTQLSEEAIFQAVSHAVQTHAALSAIITDERAQPAFVLLQEVHLDKVVKFVTEDGDTDIGKLIEEEFNKPIIVSNNLPLWRLLVTADNHIIFSWHHAIGDGKSGLAVLQTILQGLNRPKPIAGDTNTRIVKPISGLKLTAAIEDLTDVSYSVFTLLSALYSVFIPAWWTLRKTWTGGDVPEVPLTSKNHVRIIHIEESTTSRLISSARAHKTTLTAVLYVLSIVVLTKLVNEKPTIVHFKRFISTVTLSLRPLAGLSENTMSDSSAAYIAHDDLMGEFAWDRASAFSKVLRNSVPKSREAIGTIKLVQGRLDRFFTGKVGKRREASMELSNVGRFAAEVDEKTDGQWRIGETYFAQDNRYMGAALKVNTVGTPSGSVNISVTWGENVVDNALATAFVEELNNSILVLSRDGQ